MATLIERLLGWSRPRQDAAPLALPGLVESQPTPSKLRLDSVVNFLTGLGGSGDKGAAARPNVYTLALRDEELRSLYGFNGMARRIVDLLPKRACRRGWTVPEIGDWDRQAGSWNKIRRGMSMGRLYGGAIVWPVTEDDVPPEFRSRPAEWLAQPLDLRRVGAVRALQVFDAFDAQPMALDRDVASPTYRLPLHWSIGAEGWTGRLHASRVLYFPGAERPPSESSGSLGRFNRMPSDSILQALWDDIARLTQVMQGGATLAQELRESVLKVGDLSNQATGDEAAAFQLRLTFMQQMKSMMGLILLGPNDEYSNRSNPPTGWGDLSEGALKMLCTVLGWPSTMLTGEAPGGLSNEDGGGLERERQIISEYQEDCRPQLEQLYRIVYASQDGPTRGVTPPQWDLKFNPLDEPSEEEIADLRKVVAETDAIYISSGVYGPEVVAAGRFGVEGWALNLPEVPVPDPEDDAAIDALRAELEAAQNPLKPQQDAVDADSACVYCPAADPNLRSAVERAIGQSLNVEGPAHVTLLYLGRGLSDAQVTEVATITAEEAATAEPVTLERGTLRAFPAGKDGTPIVLEFEAWGLERLQTGLLRRLAHLVTAPQHRRYRPHVTVGYAPTPLTPEAQAALLGVAVGEVRVPISQVYAAVGERLVAAVPVGA